MIQAGFDFLKTWYWLFGLWGCIVITISIIGAIAVYRGREGETYSLLNHYISELGEVGVSRRAAWFNIGMILTGLFFLPFTTGLGLVLDNIWGTLGIIAGLWAGVSCLLVGIYPMNKITEHGRAARREPGSDRLCGVDVRAAGRGRTDRPGAADDAAPRL